MGDLTATKYLKKKDYISFSGAMFANGAITGMMQGYLMAYCITVIPTAYQPWLAIIFLLAKIWDGINDPIMGSLIDRTRSKYGKMRPYILFMAVPYGIVTIFMFMNNIQNPVGQLIFLFVGYLIWDMMSTLVDVPLQGLYTVITPNNTERTKLITFTRIVGSVGEQSALVVTSLLFIFMEEKRTVLTVCAVIIGVIAPILLIVGILNTKERISTESEEKIKLLDSFRYLFRNKPLLILICSNLLTFFRNLVSAMIIYVVACVFYAPEKQIIFSLPGAIASVLGMTLAPALKKRFDSKKIFVLATLAHSLGLVIVFVAGKLLMANNMDLAMWIIAVTMFIAMLPVGLLNTVPTLMATDTIDYMEWKTGQRAEGMTFSLMTLRSKVSSGLKDGVLVLLLVVLFRFQGYGNDSDLFPEQTDFTKNGIFLMYTIIPAVLNLVSLIPMKFYPLDGKTVEKINAELVQRRGVRGESSAPVAVATASSGDEFDGINMYK